MALHSGRHTFALAGDDRRCTRRYPIQLDLHYKVLSSRQVVRSGFGKTCDISSGGLSFQTDEILPAGLDVELSIQWPFLLQDACPLKLWIKGRTVRSDAHGTAMRTDHYEFRTQGFRGVRGGFAQGEHKDNSDCR